MRLIKFIGGAVILLAGIIVAIVATGNTDRVVPSKYIGGGND